MTGVQTCALPIFLRLDLAGLPALGTAAHALDQPVDLACADRDPAGLGQMQLGLLIAGFVGAFQTDQPRQRRAAAAFQSQGGVGRIMALLFAGMIIIVPGQREAAKQALDLDGFATLAPLPWPRLVAGIDLVGGRLEQIADHGIGRLEDRRAQQHLQLLDRSPCGRLGLKLSDQLLDFLLLGEEEVGR